MSVLFSIKNNPETYQYFKFERDSEKRVFKVKTDSDVVVQVVVSHSTTRRRGLTSMIGIHYISMATLRTNYGWKQMFLDKCSKSEFDKYFFQIIQQMHKY